MLPVADALAIVLEQTTPLPPTNVKLAEAQGLTLATDAIAQEALPPFPASVKDGYAVVAADGPGTYPVVGQITAGTLADFQVTPGSVAYITTGAPLPSGADAVVMIEETLPQPDIGDQPQMCITVQVQPGDDVRAVGVDMAIGQQVLQAGDRLGAAEIGLLATTGMTEVAIHPRPRVAILSTGDELLEPNEPLSPGKIRDSNRAMLYAAVEAAGGLPINLGIARDDPADISARVKEGLDRADILLTSGGVSMGELDLIKPLLEQSGKVHFGRLLMKPGKPLTFATVPSENESNTLVFGLPGNPVSSLVTFYLMVVPAIRRLAGWPDPQLRRVQAQLAQPLFLDAQRPEYHRAVLTWDNTLNQGAGGYLATSTGQQASSRLLSMRTANALLELPQREGQLEIGMVVSALLI